MTPKSDAMRTKCNIKHASTLGLLSAATLLPSVSNAKVYFDTDTYGDKELKIATVNRIKQKLRNAILQDNSLAPGLFMLSINDALGYTLNTTEGGPDGSIQYEMDREENKGLEKALACVKQIKSELQRTNSVSLADIVAFGGGEALETVGCPRVIVQVGRVDAKIANTGSTMVSFNNLANNKDSFKTAFSDSGLGPKEIALLGGALGEISRITQETAEANAKKSSSEDDDDDEFEPTPFVPSTFGAESAKYGARMGKGDFGSKYLASCIKGSKDSGLNEVLSSNTEVKEFVKKYGTNEKAFKEDVVEAYLKLTLLGQIYSTRNS